MKIQLPIDTAAKVETEALGQKAGAA